MKKKSEKYLRRHFIHVRLTDSERNALNVLAARRNYSQSEIMRALIRDGLADEGLSPDQQAEILGGVPVVAK